MNCCRVVRGFPAVVCALVIGICCSSAISQDTFLVENLADLGNIGAFVNDSIITLSPNHGDPHPVTGIVTPGQYWLNNDSGFIPAADNSNFASLIDLNGSSNTYDFAGTQVNVDTRELAGYSGGVLDVMSLSGSNLIVNDLKLTGQHVDLVADPNARRYSNRSANYMRITGDNVELNDAHVITAGSSPYGFGDAFGKGAPPAGRDLPPGEGGVAFIGHNKTSGILLNGYGTGAKIEGLDLDMFTFGHGVYVQGFDDVEIRNSTVTGQLFSSNDVINHPAYQEYGVNVYGQEMFPDILISGSEDGIRYYGNDTTLPWSEGLIIENVEVTNMREAFSLIASRGTVTVDNASAYGNETGFEPGLGTVITNSRADVTNGPLLYYRTGYVDNTNVEIELVGDVPQVGRTWDVAYINGENNVVTLTSDIDPSLLSDEAYVRVGQRFNDWRHDIRDLDNTSLPADGVVVNNLTGQITVLGTNGDDVSGFSLAGTVNTGDNNNYDGLTLVLEGTKMVLDSTHTLGNEGTVADGSLDANASIVYDGATLEIEPGQRISNQKLTITGNGVDGNGALYTDGQTGTGTRFGSSSGADESTIFLDGDASIGVGVSGNQLLVGRIQGTGNLTKRGSGILAVEKSSTLDGDLFVAEGEVVGRSNVVRHSLSVAAGGKLKGISGNTVNTPDGRVQLDGTLDLNGRTDAGILGGVVGLVDGSGQITSSNPNVESGAALAISGSSGEGEFTGGIDGDITLVKSGESTQTLGGFLTHTGTTTVAGGGLYIDGSHSGGGDYTVADGTLGGEGAIQANVTVEDGATVAPGSANAGSTGTLDVVGDYSQAAGSTLAVEIQDASNYDQLNVLGAATLAGVFDLTSSTPEQLNIGDTLTLVDSTEDLSGQFDLINGVAAGDVDGFSSGLAVQYGAKSVTATVALLGDANLDGDVDVSQFNPSTASNEGDASILLSNLGTTSGALWTDGDFNGDGDVDVSQFDPVTLRNVGDASILLANLGRSVGSSATASSVPEPGSAIALFLFATSWITRRNRC